MKSVSVESLKIGDVIQIGEASPYLSATVYKIDREKGIAHAVRPFITYHHALASEDRMFPLIGTEEMQYFFYESAVTVW